MVKSIVAPIERRNANREHFPLAPRDGSLTMHELQIQLIVLVHDCRMNAVNLEDVVGIGNATTERQLLFSQVEDERHA